MTFDFIWNCWKTADYPDGFDDMLADYLDGKYEIFSNATVNDIPGWLKRVLVSLEIGMLRDTGRFVTIKDMWEDMLGRKWVVSIEDKWVEWK